MEERSKEWWDVWFLELAKYVSTASKDPSTKVGAVLVNPETKIVVGLGYNGFPRGIADTNERLNNRELKYKMVVHAEVNACLMAGERAKGATLYVYPSFMSPPICNECVKVAVQAGVKEIVGYEVDESKLDERQLRWKESILLSRSMWDEAGLTRRSVKV
jgi:dCMP deaminase